MMSFVKFYLTAQIIHSYKLVLVNLRIKKVRIAALIFYCELLKTCKIKDKGPPFPNTALDLIYGSCFCRDRAGRN